MTNKITKILGAGIAFAGAIIAMASGKDTKAESTTTTAVSNNSSGGEGKNETEITNEPEIEEENN